MMCRMFGSVNPPAPANEQPTGNRRSLLRRPSLSTMILMGLATGIACGVFFGEYCAPLQVVGEAFVRLLQMTVLPYIIVALVANLGRLPFRQTRALAIGGGLVLLGLWAVGLLTVALVPLSFPDWKAGSFFSTALTEPPPRVDFLGLFIPSNVFASLAENGVPAVVVFCICVGLALPVEAERAC